MEEEKEKTVFQKVLEEQSQWNSFELEQLNDEIFRLLLDEPFFGEISLGLMKFPSRQIKTLAVGFSREKKGFYLVYNPDFLAQLSRLERKGCYIHEQCHIALDHLTHRLYNNVLGKKTEDGSKSLTEEDIRIINLGQDAAINSMPEIKSLIPNGKLIDFKDGAGKQPFYCIMPGQSFLERVEQGQSTEFYIDWLSKNSIPKYVKTLDEHDFGDEIKGPESFIAREKIFSTIRSAAKKSQEIAEKTGSHKKAWGSLSQSMAAKVIELIKSQPPNSEEVLKHFLDSIGRGSPKTTWSKRNRRLPNQRPKRVFKRMPNIFVAVDSSGSVGDSMMGYFLDIVDKYRKYFDFTFAPFDTNIYLDTIQKVSKTKRLDYKRELTGGTDFNAPTDYVNQNRQFDGLIICSDMYAPLPIPCRVPRLWFTNYAGYEYFRSQGSKEPIMVMRGLE